MKSLSFILLALALAHAAPLAPFRAGRGNNARKSFPCPSGRVRVLNLERAVVIHRAGSAEVQARHPVLEYAKFAARRGFFARQDDGDDGDDDDDGSDDGFDDAGDDSADTTDDTGDDDAGDNSFDDGTDDDADTEADDGTDDADGSLDTTDNTDDGDDADAGLDSTDSLDNPDDGGDSDDTADADGTDDTGDDTAVDGTDNTTDGTDDSADDASTDGTDDSDDPADSNDDADSTDGSPDLSGASNSTDTSSTDSTDDSSDLSGASNTTDTTGTDDSTDASNSTTASTPSAAPAAASNANCASSSAPPNTATIALIEQFEGFVASPKPDPIGLPTVGFGHKCVRANCAEVPFAFPLSQATAGQLLSTDAATFTTCLHSLLGQNVVLNDNQFGALTSFTFNLGCGTFQSSTMLKRLNNGEDPNTVAAAEIPRFNKAGGKVLSGLSNRRAAEVQLFQTPSSVTAQPLC